MTRRNSPEYDKTDLVVASSTSLFTLVQDAAKYAPVPYLQEAAGSVIFILNTIANTKNNKEDLKALAKNAVSLIAAIWRSYESSNAKNEWPSRDMRDAIIDLVEILDSIVVFVNQRLSKRYIIRVVYNVLDTRKIIEFRQRMTSAIQHFQVISDLNVNQMLSELLEKQDALLAAAALHNSQGQPQVYSVFAPNGGQILPMPSAGPSRPSAVPIVEDSNHGYQPQHSYNAANVSNPPNVPTRYNSNPRQESSYGRQLQFSNITNTGISIGGGSVSVRNS